MSEYTSSRGDGSGRSQTPGGTYTPPVIVPRSGYQSGNTSVKKGLFVYVKSGYKIYFYNKPDGGEKVGKQGKQTDDPNRSGTDFVGLATGLVQNGYIQVEWVNEWTEAATVKPNLWALVGAIGTIYQPATKKTENKVSWVKIEAIETRETYTDPSNPTTDDYIPDADSGGGGTSSGIDATTLGLAAVGAALIFGKKKRKKR